MKDSKTILTQHIVLIVLLQILVVVIVALPALDPYRKMLSEAINLPITAFWIPVLVALVVGNALIIRRLHSRLVEPLQELVNQTKLGPSSFAFKIKSMNTEEDHLKHFIESQALKFQEMEQEVLRMEEEVQRITDLAETSPEEVEELRTKLADAKEDAAEHLALLGTERERTDKLQKEIAQLKKDLKARNIKLETLALENPSKVEHHDFTAEDNLSSILAERLKNPLNLINNLSWRLARSWEDTPPSKVRDGLEEICRQSEEQLEMLKKYAPRDKEQERDAL